MLYIFLLVLTSKVFGRFLWIPDPGFPDRIRILWPIRTQEKKKSDPDPEYVTQFFLLILTVFGCFFHGSGFRIRNYRIGYEFFGQSGLRKKV